MPSVAEELAALRGRGLASKEAGKLKGAGKLSTPENVVKDLKDNKTNLKHVDAVEASTAVDQETEWALQQSKLKVADKGKKKEAAKILQGYKGATEAAPDLAANTVKAPAAAAAATKAAKSPPAVESVEEAVPDLSDIPDLDGVPDLEPAAAAAPVAVPEEGKQNRAEKKARKALQKLGMRQVIGIARATFKMRTGIFAIDQPDVFASGKSYVVFGEAKQQDAGGQMAQAARQFQQPAMQQQAAAGLDTDDVPDLVPAPDAAAAAPVEEEAVDETGIDAKDIDLVMSQASCSRSKAVSALKENDGDLVNAIMALTT